MRSKTLPRSACLAIVLILGGCDEAAPSHEEVAAMTPAERREALARKAAAEESLGELRQQVLEDRVARLEQDIAVLMARSGVAGLDLAPSRDAAVPRGLSGTLPPLAPPIQAVPPVIDDDDDRPIAPLPADLSGLVTRAPAKAAPPAPPAARERPAARQPRLTYDVGN